MSEIPPPLPSFFINRIEWDWAEKRLFFIGRFDGAPQMAIIESQVFTDFFYDHAMKIGSIKRALLEISPNGAMRDNGKRVSIEVGGNGI